MTTLFSPIQLGNHTLPNRIIMAPLTRCRAGEGDVPHALNAKYYAQRASAGLIISEASQVNPEGKGYPNTPGCYSEAQAEGWKLVTDAVHAKDGKIFLQLWHVGRTSHSYYQPDNKLPVSASAIALEGQARLPTGKASYETPRALETDEVIERAHMYGHGAQVAKEAGFDGVEIHGANSYLIDQFMRDGSNHRTDKYGGSLENRSRFLREVIESVLNVWDAGDVGIRFSPTGNFNNMTESDPHTTFPYMAQVVGEYNLAYLHTTENDRSETDTMTRLLKDAFGGNIIVCQGYTYETGSDVLRTGHVDAVAYGKLFISNPDLPERFAAHIPLNKWDTSTFYGGGAEGYTDYPFMS